MSYEDLMLDLYKKFHDENNGLMKNGSLTEAGAVGIALVCCRLADILYKSLACGYNPLPSFLGKDIGGKKDEKDI